MLYITLTLNNQQYFSRRAKAKLLDGSADQDLDGELPPDIPPALAAGRDAELQAQVHEDEREQGLLVLVPKAHYFFFTFSHYAHSMHRLVYRYMETDCHYREQARPHCLCL